MRRIIKRSASAATKILAASGAALIVLNDENNRNISDVSLYLADNFAVPLMRNLLDAEVAHKLSISLTSYGLSPKVKTCIFCSFVCFISIIRSGFFR